MDLSAMKQKLQDLTTKPVKKEKVDYSKIYWKPKPGKFQIRIVPSKFDKKNPFREIFLHYGISQFPLYSLTNWDEKDPIVEFARSLKKTGVKEDYFLGNKLEPKLRVFIPVLVRGEEEKGVRLWEVNKTIYQQLLAIATDEDYGDFTDIYEGRDITVEAAEGEAMGKTVTKIVGIRVKPKTSPLSDNAQLVQSYLENQPDILEVNLPHKKSFDDLKKILNEFLNPGENEQPVLPVTDIEKEIPDDLPFDVEPTKKVVKKDKFDKLF